MTPEKRDKIKELRQRLANLPQSQREELAQRALIATVDGHTLSAHNTIMVYFQTMSTGVTPTVVGGFKQWLRAGKCVRRGEHGYTIFFPVGVKDNDDNIVEVKTYYTGTVFDISQVEEISTGNPATSPAQQPVTAAQPIRLALPPAPSSEPETRRPEPAPQQPDLVMAGFRLI